MKDLSAYKGTLPYASELFGVYQPLLGWKSRIIRARYDRSRGSLYRSMVDRLVATVRPPVSVTPVSPPGPAIALGAPQALRVENLHPMRFVQTPQPYAAPSIDSAVTRLLRREIGAGVSGDWKDQFNGGRIGELLDNVKEMVTDPSLMEQHPDVADYVKTFVGRAPNPADRQTVLQSLVDRESTIAGFLSFLAQHNPPALTQLLFKPPKIDLLAAMQFEDPQLNFGQTAYDAILSPVGIVHLYREYFFEFDSFLGPAVGHVWLSPGGTVELIEISAKPADLADLPQPDQPPPPPPSKTTTLDLTIPFIPVSGDDQDEYYQRISSDPNDDVGYADGDSGSSDQIQTDFGWNTVTCDPPQYTLASVTIQSAGGSDVEASVLDWRHPDAASSGGFRVRLERVNFHGNDTVSLQATMLWQPSKALLDSNTADYQKKLDTYTVEKARRFKEAFYTAARDRIKLASKIDPRSGEELREEERTVVYRTLIAQLMPMGLGDKHVISELVRSMFDVDKMLYFVAPEWWAPRVHRSGQHLGQEESAVPPAAEQPGSGGFVTKSIVAEVGPAIASMVQGVSQVVHASVGTQIPSEDIVDWGGAREIGRDNYYITEESAPAKLGSSLGWLLQLDGDNLRNAMLNSPWVKAVIPIRLGREQDAINWLQQAHVEGTDGLDAQYQASPDDPPELQSTPQKTVTISDALSFLIAKIQTFNQKARTAVTPNPADPEDPRNHFAGSLPTEAVFEHGFYPLQGGVKFDQDGTEQAVFSQWMEILPTDQVVALQVEYDPKTLQIKEPKDQ